MAEQGFRKAQAVSSNLTAGSIYSRFSLEYLFYLGMSLVFLEKHAKINKVMKNNSEKVENLQAKILQLEDRL